MKLEKEKRSEEGKKLIWKKIAWKGLAGGKKIAGAKAAGFTFVETLSVIAISMVLSAGTIASSAKLIAMAKKSAARSQLEQYSVALQSYFLDCGRFPTNEQGLGALWEKPDLYPVPEEWAGPYLERKPGKDPWGTDFKYYSSESGPMPPEVPEGLPFVLMSLGADKKEGGKGEGADVCSWK